MKELYNILSIKNSHTRDLNVKFFEEGHKYCISFDPETKYTSVTTLIHEYFEKFNADNIIDKMMSTDKWKEGHKYWGMKPEEIKNQWNNNRDDVAEAGTNLHYEIECFMNDKRFCFDYTNKELSDIYISDKKVELNNFSPEWRYFINFIKDYPYLKPYRTEWIIYDEKLKIAGSIDMVYENKDGTLSIYDWKRSKNISRINNFNKFSIHPLLSHLPDTNYWHYSLQLNIYKYILEKNYEKKIKDLFLVRLHPNNIEKNYELIELPILTTEIQDLFDERFSEINKKDK